MPTAGDYPTEPPPFDGGMFIADTSAWMRASSPRIAREWRAAVATDQICTTPAVAFELLHTAQNGQEFDALTEELAALREIPFSRSIVAAARSALHRMAHHSAGLHRVPMTDVLVAAAAESRGIGVLHFDGHFDRLARFLHFESRWIVGRAA
jgi:predicted nucleic acid-binding protein